MNYKAAIHCKVSSQSEAYPAKTYLPKNNKKEMEKISVILKQLMRHFAAIDCTNT
jgi:hypothetical protein